MAEYRHYAEPDPQWTNFPNNLPEGTKWYSMTRDRKSIEPQTGLDIEEFDVPVRDKFPIKLRSYRKASSQNERLPLLVYMHGGGYVTGSLETDDPTLRALALECNIAIISIEYRLAPENPFPVGFEDSFDIVRWAASLEGQEKLGVDLKKGFILGGTSAGANFTAGISHLAVQEGLSPPLTALAFLAGSFCNPDVRPAKYRERILSVDEIDDAPGLTRKSIDYFTKIYGAPPEDKRFSPLLFDSHQGIAQKAYFSICGWDPRRDEELLLEQLLREAGMATKKDIYKGLPHGFWTTCPDLPVAKEWLGDLIEAMKWLAE